MTRPIVEYDLAFTREQLLRERAAAAPPPEPTREFVSALVRRPDWMQLAACRGMPTALFFPSKNHNAGEARQTCARCPVRKACAEYAESFVGVQQITGIWGGMGSRGRREYRATKARAETRPLCDCAQPVPEGRRKYCSEDCRHRAEVERNRVRRSKTRRTKGTAKRRKLSVWDEGRQHGELRTYKAGCRCEPCTASNAAWVRKSRGAAAPLAS